jgi:hypothetical protein
MYCITMLVVGAANCNTGFLEKDLVEAAIFIPAAAEPATADRRTQHHAVYLYTTVNRLVCIYV